MTVWVASSTDVTGVAYEAAVDSTSKLCGACGRVCGRKCAGWVAHRLQQAAEAEKEAKLAADLDGFVREMLREAKRWTCGRMQDKAPVAHAIAPRYWVAAPTPRARCVSGERTHRPSHRRFRASKL